MDNAKQMLAAARLLIEIAETLMDSEPAVVARERTSVPAKSAAPNEPAIDNWRKRPRNKKYECVACHHRFESKESLLDATCPECDSTNIVKQPQERSLA